MSYSFVTPWTVAHQAPLFIGFPIQEYWSGLPFPSARNLSDPGIEPRSSALQADTLLSEPPGKSKIDMILGKQSYIYVSSMNNLKLKKV